MDANLVIKAIDNAILNRQIKGQRLIVHTYLGSQYTGFAFENKLHELHDLDMIHSCDTQDINSYQTAKQAKMRLFQYIEGWYNRKRIHGSVGYLTPVAFEQQ